MEDKLKKTMEKKIETKLNKLKKKQLIKLIEILVDLYETERKTNLRRLRRVFWVSVLLFFLSLILSFI